MLRARIGGRIKTSRLARRLWHALPMRRVREARAKTAWTESRNVEESAQALLAMIQRRGHKDPASRYRLARIYDQAGMWDSALGLLVENLEQHPHHAVSYKLLADTSASMRRWGGVLADSIPDRIAGVFVPDVRPAIEPREAFERAVELQPAKPGWRAALAEHQLADGDSRRAIDSYQSAVADAQASTERWALTAKQQWQFGLERAYSVSGAPRVDDPLFRCSAEPAGPSASDPEVVAGLFDAQFTDLGLSVEGILVGSRSRSVSVLVDGDHLRTVVPSEDYLPAFTVLIKRRSLAHFPKRSRLELTTGNNEQLRAPGGAAGVELVIPHGDDSLKKILAAGVTLNKKGEIRPTPQEAQRRHERDLEIYANARDFFAGELGRPLFLFYGTLLGCHRDGDFIAGDDDFDVGYVSDATTPEGAKREALDFIVALVCAGFTVSFNRRGRLFRIHLDARSDRHIDVQFIWFQDGRAWAHNQACLPLGRDDFLPVRSGKLRGVDVWLPRHTEAFLRANYGPQWHVPDPGFRYYPGDVDPSIMANLARSLITVSEYNRLAKTVAVATANTPSAGRLVSIGSQDLYPLKEFII